MRNIRSDKIVLDNFIVCRRIKHLPHAVIEEKKKDIAITLKMIKSFGKIAK